MTKEKKKLMFNLLKQFKQSLKEAPQAPGGYWQNEPLPSNGTIKGMTVTKQKLQKGQIFVNCILENCENNGATLKNCKWDSWDSWNDGEFDGGVWQSGDWTAGTWKKGTWKKGIWNGGTWENGIWEKGIWKGGTWEDGTWMSGDWKNGKWLDGTWKDGTWMNGTWIDGIWKNGVWNKGTWKDGIWNNGVWKNGIWSNGKWYAGQWEGGTWKNGKKFDTNESKIIKKNKKLRQSAPSIIVRDKNNFKALLDRSLADDVSMISDLEYDIRKLKKKDPNSEQLNTKITKLSRYEQQYQSKKKANAILLTKSSQIIDILLSWGIYIYSVTSYEEWDPDKVEYTFYIKLFGDYSMQNPIKAAKDIQLKLSQISGILRPQISRLNDIQKSKYNTVSFEIKV